MIPCPKYSQFWKLHFHFVFEVQLRCILMVRCATTVEDTSQWVHYEAKVIIWCIVMAHGETSYSCGALMLWVTVWDTVNVHNCKYKCKWWVTQGPVWDPNCVIIGWDHLLCQDGRDSLHRRCWQSRIQNTKNNCWKWSIPAMLYLAERLI